MPLRRRAPGRWRAWRCRRSSTSRRTTCGSTCMRAGPAMSASTGSWRGCWASWSGSASSPCAAPTGPARCWRWTAPTGRFRFPIRSW